MRSALIVTVLLTLLLAGGCQQRGDLVWSGRLASVDGEVVTFEDGSELTVTKPYVKVGAWVVGDGYYLRRDGRYYVVYGCMTRRPHGRCSVVRIADRS